MNRLIAHLLSTAKAYTAALGSLLTLIVATVGADHVPHYKVVALVIAICTWFGTYVAPYAPREVVAGEVLDSRDEPYVEGPDAE